MVGIHALLVRSIGRQWHTGRKGDQSRPDPGRLAELSEPQLHALVNATEGVPQIAPGLLAWLEAACDWELNGRVGLRYELQPPEAAIPLEEDAVSINAMIALRTAFAQDSPEVRALFDALVELLTGAGHNH